MTCRILLLVLVSAPLLGCAQHAPPLGAGGDLDVCAGYSAFDALPDPNPYDPAAVLRVTDGAVRVLNRIKTDQTWRDASGKKQPVPDALAEDLRAIRSAYQGLRSALDAAGGDKEKVAKELSGLAQNTSLAEHNTRYQVFSVGCGS